MRLLFAPVSRGPQRQALASGLSLNYELARIAAFLFVGIEIGYENYEASRDRLRDHFGCGGEVTPSAT
jgi:hypothetical protein